MNVFALFNTNESFSHLVRQSASRKRVAELRLRYYHDRQSEDLLELIKRKWSDPEAFRLFCVNIVRKITDRRAQVYRATPYRAFEGMDQEAGEALYRTMGANVVLKKANRLTKLCKTTALKVGWSDAHERPTLMVITPNALDVVDDGEPETPSRIIVTHGADRPVDVTYGDWTADTYTRRDHLGRALPVPGNPDGVNPYRMLPFVPCFDRAPDDRFFLPGGDDLMEAQRAVNVALVNLWRSIELQAHGQAWASGVPVSDTIRVGPDRAVTLPTDGKFGFAAPNTPIEAVLKAVEFLIKQTAVANDLAANVFELEPKAESGAAKAHESRDLMEARADDLELWRAYEARLFEVLKRVVNTHRPGSIPENARMTVDFGEVSEPTTAVERLEAARRRLDMGIWSPVDALMEDNADLRSREDALTTLQERQEEAAVLGMPFAGPSFQGSQDRAVKSIAEPTAQKKEA